MAKKISLLIAVIFLIFLRFYQLGEIPHGINVDEASYGYDAYSLLKTGKDMWGEKSASLKSFGDFKPAGLSYTLIPFVNYFGLSTTTTRLPSALFGAATLIVTFYLIKELLGSFYLSLIGATILALSPWHFGLSRLFYEPNIGLFFISSSILAQIRYLQKPLSIKYLIFAALLSAIAGYYYAVLRYLGLGMLVTVTFLANYPSPQKIFKAGIVTVLCWITLAFPYLSDMFGSKGLVRMQQENALHSFGNTLVINENREMCYLSSNQNPLLTKLCYYLWNKPGEKAIDTVTIFTQLISPKYLFLSGYQKDVLPLNYGAYLEVAVILYWFGLFYLLTNWREDKAHLYILVTYLFTTLPIAWAGALNIHRHVVGLYLVLLICVYGLRFLLLLINRFDINWVKYGLIILLSFVYIWSQSRFLAKYYFVYTRQQPEIWLADTPEIMNWLGANQGNRQIKFYDYDFAPLFYAFYNRLYVPTFQSNARWSNPNQYGWIHLEGIGTEIENKDNIWREICLHTIASSPPQLLVVTGNKSEWADVVLSQFKNFTGIHVLHEVYDSQVLYNYLKAKDPVNLLEQCANPTVQSIK